MSMRLNEVEGRGRNPPKESKTPEVEFSAVTSRGLKVTSEDGRAARERRTREARPDEGPRKSYQALSTAQTDEPAAAK